MEHDWEARQFLHDGIEHVESKWRRNQTACIRVASALLRLEFICSVACTYRYGERINACFCNEVNNLFRFCIVRLFSLNLVFNTCKHAQLALNSNVVSMCIFNNLLCKCNVLVVRKSRTVDHYRREAHVHATLAQFEAVSVVKVQNNFRMLASQFFSILNSSLSHILQQSLVGIVACSL